MPPYLRSSDWIGGREGDGPLINANAHSVPASVGRVSVCYCLPCPGFDDASYIFSYSDTAWGLV